MRTEGVLELASKYYDNEFVGYRSGLLPFLTKELKDYVELLPTDEDCDLEHMEIVRKTAEVICKIYSVQRDELIVVSNLLCEDMNYKRVKFVED